MSKEELKTLSVKDLKAKCKELGLQGYSKLNEDELIDLILGAAVVETEEEIEGSLAVFKKLIKGPFGFNGKTFKGSTFELTDEEAKNPKIENAIKGKLIEIKK